MKLSGIGILLTVLLAGCAKIHMACPTTGVQTVTIGGSTVGYTLLSMAGTAAHAAGLMQSTAPQQSAGTTVDYEYVPLFGEDFVSCGAMPGPSAVATPAVR